MKRLRYLFILPMLVFLPSCEDSYYSSQESELRFYDEQYYSFVQDVVMAPPVTEVFDQYQKIRSDRAASMQYVSGYFGTWFDLYYDYFHQKSADVRVCLEGDGVYTYTGWGARRITQIYDITRTLKLTRVHEHEFEIEINAQPDDPAVRRYEFHLGAKTVIDGDKYCVSDFSVSFIEDGKPCSISSGDTLLSFPMPDGSGYPKCFPVSGTLTFTEDKYVMTVVYDGLNAHISDTKGYEKTIFNAYNYIANRGLEIRLKEE